MPGDAVLTFLEGVLPALSQSGSSSVYVTLTFAQSLDAKIAGCGGKQLILSCSESMVMTQRIRTRHDAILVGINTALNDDPQLNTRLLAPEDGGRSIPIPIILDANLRFRLDSKLMRNFKEGKGRQPMVFTSSHLFGKDMEFEKRSKALGNEGVKIIPIACDDDGKLDLKSLLIELQTIGVKSLMVEGGASIISAFLQSRLVNSLIVTVCPSIVGSEGVTYDVKGKVPEFDFMKSQIVGRDTVMAWTANKNHSKH